MERKSFDLNKDLRSPNLSDDSSTSLSGPFDNNQNLVLELHEMRKDSAKADSTLANAKPNKHRKKKKKHRLAASPSSPSGTSSSEHDVERRSKEEFFDARADSFHAVIDQLQNPVTTIGLAQALSEHGQDPKPSSAPESASAPPALSSAPPATVTPIVIKKPSTQPE